MKKFNEFLNENAQMDDSLSDNLFVTFELTFKGETYYIIAQAKNTNLQATFNEKGEKIDNFTTEFTIGEEGVELVPLRHAPQQVLDTLEKLGALKNMEIGDATSIITGLERDEKLKPKVKKYIDMGQNELNYQLNIAIDNKDWKKAEEISSYIKDK